MLKKIFVGISVFATVLFASAVFAEDAVIADPGHYTVEYENDRVRVIRIKYGPGEKSVMHSHGPHVSVFLSQSNIRMTSPDGTTQDVSSEVGVAQWTDAQEHLPENLDDKPLEVVLIELKD